MKTIGICTVGDILYEPRIEGLLEWKIVSLKENNSDITSSVGLEVTASRGIMITDYSYVHRGCTSIDLSYVGHFKVYLNRNKAEAVRKEILLSKYKTLTDKIIEAIETKETFVNKYLLNNE